MEREILKKSRGLLLERAALRFVFTAKHSGAPPSGGGERHHDAEDALPAGEVLHFDSPPAGSYVLSADRQAESEPPAVASAAIIGSEEFLGLSGGKTTALLLDLDTDVSGFDGGSQRHVSR